jgi:hypothetical protein
MKKEATGFTETLEPIWRHIPEDSNISIRSCENLKS